MRPLLYNVFTNEGPPSTSLGLLLGPWNWEHLRVPVAGNRTPGRQASHQNFNRANPATLGRARRRHYPHRVQKDKPGWDPHRFRCLYALRCASRIYETVSVWRCYLQCLPQGSYQATP